VTDDDCAATGDFASNDDDHWGCLTHSQATCGVDNSTTCTWCMTQAGYGLCLGGDSAASAQDSAWFDCDKWREAIWCAVQEDPYDPTCAMAYLQDPTQDACNLSVFLVEHGSDNMAGIFARETE